jgi:neopullulanase
MDPGSRGAFPWDENDWDRDLFAFFRAATALRHANPVLRHGAVETLAADGSVFTFQRHDDVSSVIVALNAGEASRRVELRLPDLPGRRFVPEALPGSAAGGTSPLTLDSEGCVTLDVPARDALVLRLD